jgi:uncharacterized SAM-binding protein YcdF (DUF218 family)
MPAHRLRLQNRGSIASMAAAHAKTIILCTTACVVAWRIFIVKSSSSSLERYTNPQDIPLDLLSSIDAVLVLGGGAAKAYNNPPAYVQRRCDDAARVVQRYSLLTKRKKNRKKGLPVLCLSAGTAHVPQLLGPTGLPVWESTASAAYLMEKHNISNVFVETTSYDTLGNAYFARTSHTDHNSWRRLLIVTSKVKCHDAETSEALLCADHSSLTQSRSLFQFHMPRTKAIFDWIFGIDNKKGYALYYLESPDIGLSNDVLKARLAKEHRSLESVKILADSHRSLASVWHFLHTQHALYAAGSLVERAQSQYFPALPDNLRQSYGAYSNGQQFRSSEATTTTTTTIHKL